MIFVTFLVGAINFGMVLLYGSTGETITEKSGHLNLGIPGVMCVGASSGCYFASKYYDSCNGNLNGFLSILIPVLATLIGGALMGLLFSFFTVTLRANQNVTGLVLTTLGVGISKYMISKSNAVNFSKVSLYFNKTLPFADKLGWFGKIFLSYGIMIYISLVVALLTSYVMNHTKVGLHLRAVGENPATADAAGINVSRYRYIATCIGCAIAGLGGLTFIMDFLNGNWEYMLDAIGWLAVALVIFTVWRPTFGILCSIIFGACYVASEYIPGLGLSQKEIFKMLPYVVTLAVLIFTSIRNKRENQPPESLGLSYFREER